MKSGLAIEVIKKIKNEAAYEHQMYELAASLRTIERELGSQYTFDDEVDVAHFTLLLQTCLVGLPEEQSLLLKPIIRELKLNQIL
jgi:hypothetical protein